MAKTQAGKVAGNFPVETVKGSSAWHFAWPDLKSVLKYAGIASLGVVPSSLLAIGGDALHAGLSAGLAAGVGVVIKALQRFASDTR